MNPVCLITPPSTFLLDERTFVSLGILRIAAVLERAGIPVEHLDLCGITNFEDALKAHALRSSADIFGITATTPQMPATNKIAAALRQVRPDARLILGGPHITLVAAAWRGELAREIDGRAVRAFNRLQDTFDVLVAGDGEEAIFLAIEPNAPRFINADDPASDLFLTHKSYEQVPFPARHLVDMGSYHYSIEGVRSTSLIAQLGCPFRCAFCGGRESAMLRRIRTRSTESVVSELADLHDEYGFTGFMLYDDELNVNRKMVELMNAIGDLGESRGVAFKLRGFIKSELFNEEQARAMYRAGFRWILVGFESGSPRILENIQKNATREENTRCLQIARAAGLKVKALMSIGHAGESGETVADTKAWLLEQRPDDFDCTIISCYPGTPYYDRAVQTASDVWSFTAPKSGDKLHAIDVDYSITEDNYKGMPGEYHSFVFTDHLSPDDLVRLRDDLEDEVRAKLRIPFNAGAPGIRYEASYGMLPGHILRRSRKEEKCASPS